MSIDNVKLRRRGGGATALHRNMMAAAAAAEACQLAVMQQHLRKACGGKFKFFCPVGGKTSWLAKPSQHHCHSLAELLLAEKRAAAAA